MHSHNNGHSYPHKVNSKQILSKAQELDQWSGWGWSVFFGQIAIAFGLLFFGLTHFAFASASHDGSENIRPIYVQEDRSSWTEAKGEISWIDGHVQIKDEKSGKVYKLTNTTGLRQLYDSGVKNIAVSGILADADTIKVDSMSLP
jgi:hypothetical protein